MNIDQINNNRVLVFNDKLFYLIPDNIKDDTNSEIFSFNEDENINVTNDDINYLESILKQTESFNTPTMTPINTPRSVITTPRNMNQNINENILFNNINQHMNELEKIINDNDIFLNKISTKRKFDEINNETKKEENLSNIEELKCILNKLEQKRIDFEKVKNDIEIVKINIEYEKKQINIENKELLDKICKERSLLKDKRDKILKQNKLFQEQNKMLEQENDILQKESTRLYEENKKLLSNNEELVEKYKEIRLEHKLLNKIQRSPPRKSCVKKNQNSMNYIDGIQKILEKGSMTLNEIYFKAKELKMFDHKIQLTVDGKCQVHESIRAALAKLVRNEILYKTIINDQVKYSIIKK